MSIKNQTHTLCFGRDARWEISDAATVARIQDSTATVVDDIEKSVEEALLNPIGFPSLDQAVVPGDRVVFAVEPTTPRIANIVPGVLSWFAERGTSPQNMTIVLAGNEPELAQRVADATKNRLGDEVGVEVHNADDENDLAYLAANEEAAPIYLNRTMVDADVAIPITTARAPAMLDYFGAFSLYPLLADRSAQSAFYRLTSLLEPASHQKLIGWADEAARWAGFLVSIEVVPAGSDAIAGIVAGLTESTSRAATESMQAVWGRDLSAAPLTIALLEGAEHQNWLGVARAMWSANKCTEDKGSVVVCTQADLSIGKSLARLRDSRDSGDDLLQKFGNDGSEDTIVAAVLNEVTRDKHVYFVSDMRSEAIEAIGMGPLADQSELQRLVDQFDRSNVLRAAQFHLID